MIEGIPRISICIITYKQENIISRALDSLLSQKDYLYEICISDDCSPDGTWQVLLDYQNHYPGLIKIHRNELNVGIFANVEQTWTMPTGDVVYFMAGDDEAGEGWFKEVVDYIQNNKIDYKNELFCIYGDYKTIYPNGDCYVSHNKPIQRKPKEALRLSLRGLISSRGCCYSVKVMKQFEKVSQGRSHIAETAQDRQLQLFSNKNYYIPFVGNIYYSYIGVSTRINEDNLFQERLRIWPYAEDYLKSKGVCLCQKDKYYGRYNISTKQFRHKHSIGNFFKMAFTYLMSRDLSLPSNDILRHLVFAVLRRFPHKKPIRFN